VREPAPPDIRDAAERRAAARRDRDWATADALRGRIEAAGWRVVDDGPSYRLERAHPADVDGATGVRFGRSASVPSRLDEAPVGPATVVVVAGRPADETVRCVRSILAHAPAGTSAVVVADALDDADVAVLRDLGPMAEIVWTAAPLGFGAAVNIGLRRASGVIAILADPSIEASGDVVGPLGVALADDGVAVAGPYGLVSRDLRTYEEVTAGEVAAVQGYLVAFRRSDVAARGPLDEHFRFYRNLDIWWSLVLRDEGGERAPRRAVAIPHLPVLRHEHRGWTSVPEAERARLSKRNFYRIIDRFGHRRDLVVPGDAGPGSVGA
jgi:hypothetical protein